jgi:hypothetical protein
MDERSDRQTPSERGERARRRYFGARLRALRETYADRISGGGGPTLVLRATPSASALIDCMRREADFHISAAAYNEIENGLNVPRDAVRFINAAAICLRLSEDDKRDLARRLAYDLVAGRLQEMADEVFPPDETW